MGGKRRARGQRDNQPSDAQAALLQEPLVAAAPPPLQDLAVLSSRDDDLERGAAVVMNDALLAVEASILASEEARADMPVVGETDLMAAMQDAAAVPDDAELPPSIQAPVTALASPPEPSATPPAPSGPAGHVRARFLGGAHLASPFLHATGRRPRPAPGDEGWFREADVNKYPYLFARL